MARAVIVVDVQNDFAEGGSLAVTGGGEVARRISRRLADGDYEFAVATRDHHIDPGDHFSDEPDFVDSWPRHCVVGTDGAEFHPDLDTSRIEAVFDKGHYDAAYSGFEGFEGSADGDTLVDWLRARGVTDVEVSGLATDYCVRATALDAARHGFATTVRLDLSAGVAPESVARTLAELREAGVSVTGSPVGSDA